MKYPYTGILLSGGLNTRFAGKEKAFIQVGGKRIMDRLYEVFVDLFDEIILVTNNPLKYLEWDMQIVTDIFSIRSSLTGIHAGLFYMRHPFGFFSACDTPFLKKDLVATILEYIDSNIDIVMPETAAGTEPLCAVYSKSCRASVEAHLRQNKCKIQAALRKKRLKKISEKHLRSMDPELLSFFNINTPQDLAQAEAMIQRGAVI
jgi:molybdenum cofactor guanylyltransferase